MPRGLAYEDPFVDTTEDLTADVTFDSVPAESTEDLARRVLSPEVYDFPPGPGRRALQSAEQGDYTSLLIDLAGAVPGKLPVGAFFGTLKGMGREATFWARQITELGEKLKVLSGKNTVEAALKSRAVPKADKVEYRRLLSETKVRGIPSEVPASVVPSAPVAPATAVRAKAAKVPDIELGGPTRGFARLPEALKRMEPYLDKKVGDLVDNKNFPHDAYKAIVRDTDFSGPGGAKTRTLRSVLQSELQRQLKQPDFKL